MWPCSSSSVFGPVSAVSSRVYDRASKRADHHSSSVVGVLTSLLPAFHAECAPARYRGSIVLLDLVMCASGLTLSFWLTYGMSCKVSLTLFVPSPS